MITLAYCTHVSRCSFLRSICLCVCVCMIMHSWVNKQVCPQLLVEPQTSTSAIFLAFCIKNSITYIYIYIYLEIHVLQMSHKTCAEIRDNLKRLVSFFTMQAPGMAVLVTSTCWDTLSVQHFWDRVCHQTKSSPIQPDLLALSPRDSCVPSSAS